MRCIVAAGVVSATWFCIVTRQPTVITRNFTADGCREVPGYPCRHPDYPQHKNLVRLGIYARHYAVGSECFRRLHFLALLQFLVCFLRCHGLLLLPDCRRGRSPCLYAIIGPMSTARERYAKPFRFLAGIGSMRRARNAGLSEKSSMVEYFNEDARTPRQQNPSRHS